MSSQLKNWMCEQEEADGVDPSKQDHTDLAAMDWAEGEIDRLRRQLAQAQAVIGNIDAALADYNCHSWQYDDNMGGMALVDVFSAGGKSADISAGKAELELLAEHIRYYKPAAAEASQETKP